MSASVALSLGPATRGWADPAAAPTTIGATATPIEHLVVIFQENVSFDHYFGTYPNAANTDGTTFHASDDTPSVNNLLGGGNLLTGNTNAANPRRLGADMLLTCDQGHAYAAEQKAFDGGLMDKFVENTDRESCTAPDKGVPGLVMDYYDGNTVTGLWNYAQNYAMSDNFFGTVFGSSTPGALNLVSGQTYGGYAVDSGTGRKVNDSSVVSAADADGIGTVISDPDPAFDDCGAPGHRLAMTGRTIGDLLNAKGVTWGWFEGGFRPTTAAAAGAPAVCDSSHVNVGGVTVSDYSAHHEPFEYYESTANPHHLPPTSVASIGGTDQANHQYDLSDFGAALNAGHLPAVSFLKAPKYQDAHAGYSDPEDEQKFLAGTINALQKSPDWKSTAVVVAYDDSDGWYDHVMPPIVNTSSGPDDALDGAGSCGGGQTPLGGHTDRCGYGARLPLLVISPYAKRDHVDHAVTDQSSILRFIEDNWHTGRIGDSSFDALAGPLNGLFDFGHRRSGKVLLDPATGSVLRD
ncbi:alkaline phosphatase family protein [Catenulispora sp. NL8]|uniref:Alkaline phosphatase family protein n=1 Tax=Catenulispora pinistramenti TaxID=2705254 RepID=A0ABS5L284_9ACTN|nr:alkaline phosphatase family protein [Catenulispora pinistramenti]MBS2552406.1 alkaline phosphatase family protein [Catenulispora pinistramenti]